MKAPKSIIQGGKKGIRGLTIVFIKIRAVIEFSREILSRRNRRVSRYHCRTKVIGEMRLAWKAGLFRSKTCKRNGTRPTLQKRLQPGMDREISFDGSLACCVETSLQAPKHTPDRADTSQNVGASWLIAILRVDDSPRGAAGQITCSLRLSRDCGRTPAPGAGNGELPSRQGSSN